LKATIHSYRHRYGNAAGHPALAEIERRLAGQAKITVPTIALQGEGDGVLPPEVSAKHAAFFTGPCHDRILPRSVTTRRRRRRTPSRMRSSN
jgi:pimeloyl-ACP methyl ester carboxylesterase